MHRERLISLLADNTARRVVYGETTARDEGKRHGYPECCVDFFANNQARLPGINQERTAELGDYYKLFILMAWVPCPKCYAVLQRNQRQIAETYDIRPLTGGL